VICSFVATFGLVEMFPGILVKISTKPKENSPKAEFLHSDPFDLVEQHIHLPKLTHVRVPIFSAFEFRSR